MYLKDIILECFKKGVTMPGKIAAEYGKNANSISAIMTKMRQAGLLPSKERNPRTIRAILKEEFAQGNTSPAAIARKHNLLLSSVAASIFQLRKRGELPPAKKYRKQRQQIPQVRFFKRNLKKEPPPNTSGGSFSEYL